MPRVLQRQLHFPSRLFLAFVLLTLLLLIFSSAAGAQPFGAWPVLSATQGKYFEVTNTPDLNPPAALTIEAWVSNYPTTAQGEECRSIIGKNRMTSWWVGICGGFVRSDLHAIADYGGVVPTGQWTHIAVTYDGANRIHYINGEQAVVFPETGALPANSSNVRLASDVSWDYQPQGAIDEVRLWNYARTVEQIRGSINVPISSAQPGLVAVWGLDANGNDVVGGHNAVNVGGVPFLTFPVTLNCGMSSATTACLNTRFGVSVSYRDPVTGVMHTGQLADCPNPDSGVFWFFAPNAWEVLVKTVNGCGFNDRYWVFSAAATNLFYRLEVIDVRAGAAKIYFNYPGPPAPAVTDTAAFATCP